MSNEAKAVELDADSEPEITRMNFDAKSGKTEIEAIMPNVAILAAECGQLLEMNEAKNYVQFDMIPRAESGVQGYRVTVQRIFGKSPAQRVIEMEKECAAKDNTIATLEQEVARLQGLVDEAGQWEPVPDGQMRDHGNVWQVWQGMVGVKSTFTKGDIYAAKLPDGWRLQRRVVGESEVVS